MPMYNQQESKLQTKNSPHKRSFGVYLQSHLYMLKDILMLVKFLEQNLMIMVVLYDDKDSQ
jgi:hypothetical protein